MDNAIHRLGADMNGIESSRDHGHNLTREQEHDPRRFKVVRMTLSCLVILTGLGNQSLTPVLAITCANRRNQQNSGWLLLQNTIFQLHCILILRFWS